MKVLLIILDGWGLSPLKEGNATYLAKTPNLDWIYGNYPKTSISASGISVGITPGEVGNSEVGHLNLGSGRVVWENLPRIDQAIEKGDFPVSLEVAKERMKAVKFLAIDEISASLKEKWGDFVGRNHTVRFSSDIPQDQIYKVLTHEIFHAVSGQIEKLEYSPEYEDNPNLSSNEILKIGVQLNRVNFFTGTPLEHLRWLNEALTEEATAVLIGEELSKSYVDERRLLKLLIEKGIPKEVFFEAYFENFNVSTNKTEHSLPKMKKLFNLMNDTFGKGFLFKLDSYIKENSSKKVSGTTKAIENFDSLLS